MLITSCQEVQTIFSRRARSTLRKIRAIDKTFIYGNRTIRNKCFQIFLDKLASEYSEALNVVQLDNGRFHHSNKLKISDNVLLIFQPPYSQELNSIERVWQHIKQELSWGMYEKLDEIK